jgi:TonB family protein
MEDPVGDILAQRTALDRSAGAGLVLSITAHMALTAAAAWYAMHQPAPELVNTLTIRFTAQQATAIASSAPAAAPAPAAPRTIQEPRAAVEQPKVEKPAPPKTTAPPSPFGRSTKNAGAVEPPPPPPPTVPASGTSPLPGAAQTVGDIAVGTSGVTGLEGGDFPYTIYIENMKRLIGTRWFRPPAAAATTTVYFFINRDGTIRDAKTETPSGSGTFDRSALRAVLEASPLPPLPMSFTGNYLGVHLTFR